MTSEFATFVQEHMAGLMRFGTALTGNPHDGSDLVQIALERAGIHWSRVGSTDHPLAYLKTIMVNARSSGWRRHRRESLLDTVPDVASIDSYPADLAHVWSAVAGLPRRQRAVIVLRYVEGHSEAEIAAILGIAPGTVKSQASKAMSHLRELLSEARREPRIQEAS